MIEKTIPEIMLLNDKFSRLLGIKIIKQNSSEIVLNLKIKKKFMKWEGNYIYKLNLVTT